MTAPQNRTVESGGDDAREPAVALRNVSRYFKSYQVRALTEVTFEVRRGEVFGLLGPKGSGKSTALDIIAGRIRPTEGSVTVFGRSPRRSSVKARISYLAGTAGESDAAGWSGFFKQFRPAKQNLRSGSTEEPAREKLRRAHLTHALARNADLLVLDEPFAGLDPMSIREVTELIRALAQRGRTVILSSDSLSETRDICDHLAVLFEGKIHAVGTLDQLLAMPEAIRIMAPLLPTATADRVLNLIREETGVNTASLIPAPNNSRSAAANTARNIPQAEPSATTTASEAILTPLLKANTPAPVPATSSESPKTAVDPVNHRKLADLTRPATSLPSPSKTS